jgi:L,D-transpeptidase-like protein/putative peptidoglycan binding protein/PKD domain-containing protein
VRRAAIVLAALAFAPAAHAAPPAVSIHASATKGAAPLSVTLTASGDPATYHWDLGDGTTADGPVVNHVYRAGKFVARVTATSLTGEASQASVTLTSIGLTLGGPRTGRYQELQRFYGRLVPGLKGIRVGLYRGERRIATARTRRGGRFSLRGRVGTPAERFTVRYAGVVSNAVALAVRPGLDAAFLGSGRLGGRLVLRVRVRPAAAGTVTVHVWRNKRLAVTRTGRGVLRIRLGTRSPAIYRVGVRIAPAAGYIGNRRLLKHAVYVPNLRVGDTGVSVYALEQRLNELHFALGTVDGYYGIDTSDAVVAFQKLHGLPRTGSVDARFWQELELAHVPVPRHAGKGLHVEVSKERQVLFLVRYGTVTLVVPVSTGATGNTPVGLWHVYSKVPGYNAKEMYYSSFFIGGFAIHGYHSVPYYPASHGCIRIPIWVAPRVYSLLPYGTPVYVY